MPNVSKLDILYQYVDAGWCIFPIVPGEKKPLTKWGMVTTPPSHLEIRAQNYFHPDAGWAVHLGASGLAVLECDPRHGGTQDLRDLIDQHGPLPPTLTALSGSGGCHFYFRDPRGPGQLRPEDGIGGKVQVYIAPGLELLSTKHYTVIPPSLHKSGRRYRWVNNLDPFTVPPWLGRLADETTAREKAERAARGLPPLGADAAVRSYSTGDLAAFSTDAITTRARAYLATLPPAIQGQGGSRQTFRAACVLVLGFSLSPTIALPLLQEYNDRCQPPWSEFELRHKLEDADSKGGVRGYLLDDSNSRPRKPDAIDRELAPHHFESRTVVFMCGGRVQWVTGPAATVTATATATATAAEPIAPPPVLPTVGDLTAEFSSPAATACFQNELEKRAAAEADAAALIHQLREQSFPCEHPGYVWLEDRRTGDPYLMNTRCGRNDCKGCGRLHREEWKANVTLRLSELPPDAQVHVGDIKTVQWNTVRKQIRRADGEHFRVLESDAASLLIVSTVRFSGSEPLTPAQAIQQLHTAIEFYRGKLKPTSASAAWRLKHIKRPPKNRFFRVGQSPPGTTEEDVRTIFSDCQADELDMQPPDDGSRRVLRFRRILRRAGGWDRHVKDYFYHCALTGRSLGVWDTEMAGFWRAGEEGGGGDEEHERGGGGVVWKTGGRSKPEAAGVTAGVYIDDLL